MSQTTFRSFRLWLIILLGCTSCNAPSRHSAIPGIYYWKTVYAPTTYERQRWSNTGIRHVYVRCFDVVYDAARSEARPAGTIRRLDQADKDLHYIPVVFINPDVLQSLKPHELQALAGRIASLMSQLFALIPPPNEVQVDCDWTSSTRDAYFSLLHALRKTSFLRGKVLSATIRMHQVKYRLRTGIPPVDKGLLMCYNMGDLKRPGAHNSILDPRLAKDYLGELKLYPLALDVALPLFSWCLQFRAERLVGILRNIAPEQIEHSALFQQAGKKLFQCTADSVWMGYSFRSGDVVRIEQPGRDDIREMAAYTARNIKNDSLRIVLFHSDSLTLSKYPDHEINAVFDAYR